LQALAQQRGRPLSGDYRRRHKLPGASTVQRALQALMRNELVTRSGNEYRIAEPFLADWLRGHS
jgi:DNA-binding IclR family transcriptional regulator